MHQGIPRYCVSASLSKQNMALIPSVLKFHRQQLAQLYRNRVLVFTLLLGACLAGAALAFTRTANSDAAKLAFDRAKVNPIVVRNLGQPLQRSLLAFGEIETRSSGGEASISFLVYGPHGRGTLYADAVRFHRGWQLISLDLELPNRRGRVNLMPIQSTVPQ